MPINTVAFKKSMISWQAAAKRTPGEIEKLAKLAAAEHPDAAKQINSIAHMVSAHTDKLTHLLDDVINAKDDKKRSDAGKKALETVKQYQSFLDSSHIPPATIAPLKTSLTDLARGLSA
jgi:hypothetical protein